ncbi:hypothetical protein RJ640_022706 [Escallonia rubra]|uniref:Uncharacterized protein n=1 Tax=Escallonia rubra TaxID=112253 RepID=A0AA88UWV7_9ASTE|nr:hypothetical protein RJ640_022706 [Escallonia rubra]
MVKVLEHSRVSPPRGAVTEKSLVLTCFDLPWIHTFPPQSFILFYEFPHSSSHFLEILVPDLKNSLSLALKHFFPLSGNLILPSDPTSSMPTLSYVEGDSVQVIFAECVNHNFTDLIGNHARNAGPFHSLVPQLSPVTRTPDSTIVPIFAIQVTLFPDSGVSVGFTKDHVLCDASTIFDFMKAWGLITKSRGEKMIFASGCLPFYDRTTIRDTTEEQETSLWRVVGKIKRQDYQAPSFPADLVRSTFVITRNDIQRLKNMASGAERVSSFVVVCAYMWTCLAKCYAAFNEALHEDDVEHMSFVVNCRARLDPPLPKTYFGNCLAPCLPTIRSAILLGPDGFLTASRLIGQTIGMKLRGVLNFSVNDLSDFEARSGQRMLGVAGSPKFNFYEIDFGWGTPKKYEVVSRNYSGTMSLMGCKDSDGGLEIGLSLPNFKMDAFTAIFFDGLKHQIP